MNSIIIKEKLFNHLKILINADQRNQCEIAKIMKIRQAKVSRLKNGYSEDFSLQSIIDYLDRLGCKLNINYE